MHVTVYQTIYETVSHSLRPIAKVMYSTRKGGFIQKPAIENKLVRDWNLL